MRPEPPGLSREFRLMVTSELFQPLAFGPGEVDAVVTGGIVSVATSVVASAVVLAGSTFPTRSRAML